MERFLKALTAHRRLAAMAVLCMLSAGVGGWYLLRGGTAVPETPALPVTSVREETSVPAAVAVETAELPEPADEEPVRPMQAAAEEETPLPAADPTPVVPKEPQLVVSPLNGEILTAFAVDELVYSETFADWRTHDGIDIAAETGTSVLAASAGTVLAVREDDMLGTTVVIDHENGFQTTYANLMAQPPVKTGDRVSAGEIIGAVGTTAAGESMQGPHLHFSVSADGDAVDPNEYLK